MAVCETEIIAIPGLGPKRLKSLKDHGYDTLDKIRMAKFNDLLDIPFLGFKSTYNLKRYLGQGIDYRIMQEILEDTMTVPLAVENKNIKPWQTTKHNQIVKLQPSDFTLESTTVWSFPNRGDWATHTPEYRGNWSPRVARNIILRYSKKGDIVLDPMVGGGTTLVEATLTERNSIGIDVNPSSAMITKNRLNFPKEGEKISSEVWSRVFIGDARRMDLLEDESIDLIATHPPYANIIRYGEGIKDDLSTISDYDIFAEEMKKAADEMFRVLKPGGYCAILMGDTHNKSHYVPIAFKVMTKFLETGFILKEDVIKHEWNCWSDPRWKNKVNDRFLLTMHEHLFIFRKLSKNESVSDFRNSSLSLFRGASERRSV